jgi:hypothetical protein
VASSPSSTARRVTTTTLVVLGCAVSAGVTGWLVGDATRSVSGDRNAPWILGRAAGLSSYVLLVLLVAMGLVLSHPGRARIRRPSSATRIRLHVSLAVFTLVLIVLHVVVLATDSYAGVGWRGSLVPLGSSYRPVPVTLGVVGLYAGLLAGVTATLAGRRLMARVWWPIHKVAAVSFLLVWAHGLYAGVDTRALLWLYLVTGFGLLVLAIWRYVAQTPADVVEGLAASPDTAIRHRLQAVDSGTSGQSTT